jgi:cytochrome c biogenesis protein ResB
VSEQLRKAMMRIKHACSVAWNGLLRLDVAAALVAAVLLAAVLSSCFPTLTPELAADAGRLATWEAGIRARYGALADVLMAGGAFSLFRSPIFLVPLAALALATLACALDRWRKVWRRVFYRPALSSDAPFTAAPYTASLAAAPDTPWPSVIRDSLEQRGFHVQSQTLGDILYLRGDRNRLAPLATLINHLAILLLLLGAGLSSAGWREEVTIGPGQAAAVGQAAGLAARNDRFAIERHADGSVAAYRADITLLDGGREVIRRAVQVNQPLTYGSLGFYLRGYAETDGGTSVTLLAVYDPGYGLVIAAGAALLLGLVVIFYFPACSVYAQVAPGGTLRLAGQADRRTADFGREFEALVSEFGRAARVK